jgi:hypothetical protein
MAHQGPGHAERRDEGGQQARVKTYAEAKKARTEPLNASAQGTYSEPSKQPFAAYLASWLDGLQHSPQTTASYRKNVRLHIAPALGRVPLAPSMVFRILPSDFVAVVGPIRR